MNRNIDYMNIIIFVRVNGANEYSSRSRWLRIPLLACSKGNNWCNIRKNNSTIGHWLSTESDYQWSIFWICSSTVITSINSSSNQHCSNGPHSRSTKQSNGDTRFYMYIERHLTGGFVIEKYQMLKCHPSFDCQWHYFNTRG